MSDPTRRDQHERDDTQTLDLAQDETVRLPRHELIEDLLARVRDLRNRHDAADRERIELCKARDLAEREREQLRTERDLALRRAETAEHRLADVQARINALEDSLRQAPGRLKSVRQRPGACPDTR